MTVHSRLLKDICEMLTKNRIWYVRTNSHGYGRKGVPDILGCCCGKFFAIEAKVLPDKPSPWQRRELSDIQSACGRTLVAYSLDDAIKFVGGIEDG